MTEHDETTLALARGAAIDYSRGRPADEVFEELLTVLLAPDPHAEP